MLDSVDKTFRKYDAHPSICKIRENVKITNNFEFSEVSTNSIAVQIKQLISKKASPVDSIPVRILKENSDVFSVVIQFLFNSHMSKYTFPEELKAGDIASLFKQEDAFSKKKYRPSTVLLSVSKIFERLMQNQMLPFVQSFMSPLLCGFREGYGTQHALILLIEACNKSIDSGGIVGAVLTDLSKAFDCLDHESLIAKLNAHGFNRPALLFVHSYLDSRKQRVRVIGSFSMWTKPLWVCHKVLSWDPFCLTYI